MQLNGLTYECTRPSVQSYINQVASVNQAYVASVNQAILFANPGPVHTETFSCVFVLFQVMSWLFSIPLRTVNNTKTQENVSVCMGLQSA